MNIEARPRCIAHTSLRPRVSERIEGERPHWFCPACFRVLGLASLHVGPLGRPRHQKGASTIGDMETDAREWRWVPGWHHEAAKDFADRIRSV